MRETKRIKRYALGITMVWLGGLAGAWCQTPASSSSAGLLTLDEAITLALRHNRLARNAQLEVEKSEDRLAAVRTRRWPAFNLTTLGSQLLSPIEFRLERGALGSFPATGPIPERNTLISTPRRLNAFIIGQVSQPLSQQYRLKLNIEQLALGRAIAQEQARSQYHTIVNDVKRAYYGLRQTQSALRSAEETVKLYSELDRVTGEYVVQQVALKSDNLEVKTRRAKAELDVLNLTDLLASQSEQLNHLLGRDIRTEFRVSRVPESGAFEVDLVAAQRRVLEQRPEVKEARLKVTQAEYGRRAKRAEFIPDVSLTFHYLSPQNLNFVPRNILSAGVMLSWEPFDWGRKKRELSEAARTIEQARNSLREAESLVLMDVNSKYRKLQQSRQLLRIAQLAQEAGRENVRVKTNRYKLQAALLKDVLQAQTSLEEANSQYQQALLTFWTAQADFEKAVGEDR